MRISRTECISQIPKGFISLKKPHLPSGKCGFFLAEDEGFEPPQTESESGVLPLHKSSIWLAARVCSQATRVL